MPSRLINGVKQARYGDVVLLGGLLVILFVLHVGIPGTVPTGAEPGIWLALAREARGLEVMSAEVTQPIFSALIAILLILGIPPIDGLLAVALLAKAALVVAVYLTSLTLNRVYATVSAALVATAAAQTELYASGGYPQLLGMAFGLLAVFLIVRYVDTRAERHLWIGLGLAAATLATDLVIGALVPVVIGLAIVSWLLLVNDGRSVWEHEFRVVWKAAGLTALVALVLFLLWAGAGGESILNPLETSRWESLSYVFRDAPWLWAVMFIGAVIVLPLRYWPAHIAATLAAAASWLVASGVFFLITGAQSGLLISQMSVVVLAVIGIGATHEHLVGPEPRRFSVKDPRSVRNRLLIIVGIPALTFLVVAGLAFYWTTADRYRLVDHAELAALNSLSAESGPGDLVVAARGKGGMAVGWWVEGFAGVPTYTAHDLRLLAFREQREQAEAANDIFNGALNDAETLAKLREIGADYLVVDRRGPDSAFLNSDLANRMRVIDDSSNLVIFDARTDS